MGTFFETLIGIIFKPKEFFETTAIDHPVSGALVFYFKLLLVEIFLSVGVVMAIAGSGLLGIFTMLFFKSPLVFGIALLTAFASLVVALFIFSAIMHIFVLIFQGRGGFSGTFTLLVCGNAVQILFFLAAPVLIFSMQNPASPNAFLIISAVIYIAVVAIWMLIVQIIGYTEIHRMGTLRAVAALLIPMALFVLLGLSPAKNHIPKFGRKAGVFTNKEEKISLSQENIKVDAPIYGSIDWRYDFTAALEEATAKKSVIMADFYTDWCGWCKKLDAETHANKDVVELAKPFVCVKINGDKNIALVERYNVHAYPTIIFLNSDGTEVKRVNGYINSQEFIEMMKQIRSQEIITASQPITQDGINQSLKDKDVKELNVEKFKLKGIVSAQAGYSALINGSYVKTGDSIGNAKVVEVSKESVRIGDEDGNEIVLRP